MDIVFKLEEQIKHLTQELNETKEHLKNILPHHGVKPYENHKEELLEK